MSKKHNKQYAALKTFMRRYKIDPKDITVKEFNDSVVIEFKGKKLLLKSTVIMTTDTMIAKYGASTMFHLPEFSYQVLVWLYNSGYHNQLFKLAQKEISCHMCREQYGSGFPAGFMVTTKDGMEPACPDHAMNYPVKNIIIYDWR